MNRHRRHAWIPDRPDQRDLAYVAPKLRLSSSVDLTPVCPPVVDQGRLGSCTGNSTTSLFRFVSKKLGLVDAQFSRLFAYYNGRELEGTTGSDSGAMLRDVIKGIVRLGVCLESAWPYLARQVTAKPVRSAYAQAMDHQAIQYQRLNNQSLADLKSCLASGFPFVLGFTVYESFESAAVATSGVAPLPGRNESTVGGHAVMAVGYDDRDGVGRFRVMNSWGAGWGQRGYFTIPYSYLTNTNLADDFWTIRTIEG